jgi:hypothetical protein
MKIAIREIPSALKARISKYFSGKLIIVQLSAGVGALALRSAAVYMTLDFETWHMILASMLGSFTGYIGAYSIGYWVVFRKDYRESGRSMPFDVFRLQLVEQLPNIWTVVGSGLTQGALIRGTEMSPILAANIGSWFGPQKILNAAAMLTSNSLKKAWVDGTWKPLALIQRPVRGIRNTGRKWQMRLKKRSVSDSAEGLVSMSDSAGIQSGDAAYDKDGRNNL